VLDGLAENLDLQLAGAIAGLMAGPDALAVGAQKWQVPQPRVSRPGLCSQISSSTVARRNGRDRS